MSSGRSIFQKLLEFGVGADGDPAPRIGDLREGSSGGDLPAYALFQLL
ncbi:hypothetical protein [Thermus sp.]